MRGAYEAGAIAGMIEILGLRHGDAAPFDVFCGTSVGAINAAYLAAHADDGTMDIDGLLGVWSSLEITEFLRANPLRMLLAGVPWRGGAEYHGRSILDPRPLQRLLQESIPWARLHANVERGLVRAIMIAALDVADGHTTLFGDFAPGVRFQAAPEPRREVVHTPLTAEHVMASFAIPLLFPARRIGRRYFCEGGLRFNTPIAPAIRAGAERLVVVSLLTRRPPRIGEDQAGVDEYPSPFFLAGKVLNALLLDPVVHDLQVLERFNRLITILERTVPPAVLEQVQEMLLQTRGAPYRRIRTLHIEPSEDLGRIAGAHLANNLPLWKLSSPMRALLRYSASANRYLEADLASYLLFDGRFAERLVELGRRDARARADEVHRFFESPIKDVILGARQ